MRETLLAHAHLPSYRTAGLLAFLLSILVLGVNEASYRAEQRAAAQRDFATDARLSVGRVRRLILTLESAQRGYMLTGRAEYREPYNAALPQAPELLQAVRALSERRPEQRGVIEQLATISERKLSELAEVMRMLDSGNSKAALDLMLTGIGREQSERIESLVDAVVREEDLAIQAASAQRQRIRDWGRLAVLAMIVISLVSLLASLRQARERERERLRHLADLSEERDKLEGEVLRRTAELTDLARHLQSVREDERGHLARELHDELGGLLTAAKMDLARLRKRLPPGGSDLAERIVHLGQTLDAGIALKRRIIEDLRPSSLRDLGLARTLEILCSEFATRSELNVQAEIAEVAQRGEPALALYRVVQESLTNIAKYAKASQVRVRLAQDGNRVLASVEDNGVGFDPAQVRAGSHGLAGMRFRMQSCGGGWKVTSAPGRGTRVEAWVPLAG